MKLKYIAREYLESIKYSIKLRTYLYYLQMLEIYLSNFNEDLSQKNLNMFIAKIKNKYSVSTTKSIKSLIKRSLNFAFEKGLIDEKLDINIQLKNVPVRKVKALGKSEQLKIEKHILQNKKVHYYGILFSLWTGLRLGEIIALKWCSVDCKNRIVYVDKSAGIISQNHKSIIIKNLPQTQSSIREIPLSKQLLNLLKDFQKLLL